MEERLHVPRDIVRQRELLDTIHLANYRQLVAAGTIGRLLRTPFGHILTERYAYAHPYRNIGLEDTGDITSLEIGVMNQAHKRRIIDIGHLTVANEIVVYDGFTPQDVKLVDGMLDGLLEDYNYGLLPNLNESFNQISAHY